MKNLRKCLLTTRGPAALVVVAATALGLFGRVDQSVAQTCGTEYVIKEGETLAQIAARTYGNPAQWTAIFYANQDRLGTNATLLVPGLSIRLPCIGGAAAPSAAAPAVAAPAAPSPNAPPPAAAAPAATADSQFMLSSMVRRIEFLTADGYSPYTGRALEGGGMLTQVLSGSMDLIKQEAKGQFDFGISWVNDWAAHLNPLLLTRAFDLGFPWDRPNCENPAELEQSAQFRCQRFFFSDPLYEVVTVVFVRSDSKIRSLRTEDIAGTTVCRPAGYLTQDFDQNGRRWLKDGKITLMRPPTIDECFRLLMSGTVDSVAIAELVGRASVASLGLTDKVRTLEPPLALTGLHVVVSRTHPYSRTMLYYVNSALAKLRESGEYERIVERHLAKYWESQTAAPSASVGTTPAVLPKAAPTSAPSAGPARPAPTSTAKTEQPVKGTQ